MVYIPDSPETVLMEGLHF